MRGENLATTGKSDRTALLGLLCSSDSLPLTHSLLPMPVIHLPVRAFSSILEARIGRLCSVKDENLPSTTVANAPSKWMTTAEAAAYLRTKPRTLLEWVRVGSIKAWPLHGTVRRTWRFRKEYLDSALGFVAARTPEFRAIVVSVICRSAIMRRNCMKRATRFAVGSVVYDKRRRTWHLYTYENGKRRNQLIGHKRDLPTRSAALRAAAEMRQPSQPATKPESGVPTVQEPVTAYLQEKAPTRKDTRRSYQVWGALSHLTQVGR